MALVQGTTVDLDLKARKGSGTPPTTTWPHVPSTLWRVDSGSANVLIIVIVGRIDDSPSAR